MNWMEKQISLCNTHSDNSGRAATFRRILLPEFALDHTWLNPVTKKVEIVNDLDTIIALRALDRNAKDYDQEKKLLKSKLQCYTQAALLETKAIGKMKVIAQTNIMQLDFDYDDIKDYDVEDLKKAVFDIPFVGFCGLSCSGDGFYALVLIAEKDRLSEYAEHCFEVLLQYGIKADESKGKKVENLRYLSYDANMLIRENPVPLKIKRFKRKKVAKKDEPQSEIKIDAKGSTATNGLNRIKNAPVGSRVVTIQKEAYTLGGLNDNTLLPAIKEIIKHSSQYARDIDKYCKCAEDCFNAGANNPFKN